MRILVDIDGVMNAFNAHTRILDEWMTDKMGTPWYSRDSYGIKDGYVEASAAGYRLIFHEDHPDMIAELEATGAEMIWSTMWTSRAPQEFAPVAGFGDNWPYINFHAFQTPGLWRSPAMTGQGVGSFKHPGIAHTAGSDPVVVIDDDLQDDNYEWAERRNAAGLPTLLIQPDPAEGLTWEQVRTIQGFAASVASMESERVIA